MFMKPLLTQNRRVGDVGKRITRRPEQATTSGTEFDFNNIPPWVTRITIMFEGISLSGTDDLLVQIGDSGGIVATGYVSTGARAGGSVAVVSSTSGFIIFVQSAAEIVSGHMVLTHMGGNTWISSHSGKKSTGNTIVGGGDKTLSGVFDRVRLTRSGTNTFDAGSVNILVE